jgi:hypothetical protein
MTSRENYIKTLRGRLAVKRLCKNELDTDIQCKTEELERMNKKLKTNQMEIDKIIWNLKHPTKRQLHFYAPCLSDDLMNLILSFLNTWCLTHDRYYYGSRCTSCMEYDQVEEFSQPATWVTHGPVKFLQHKDLCKWIDIVPENKCDRQLLDYWFEYSNYTLEDCACMRGSKTNFDNSFRFVIADHRFLNQYKEDKLLPPGLQLSFYMFYKNSKDKAGSKNSRKINSILYELVIP